MRGKLGWGRACLRILRKGSGPARLQAQLYTSPGQAASPLLSVLSLPTNDTWMPSYQPLQAASIVGRDRGGGKTQP